MIRSMLFLPGNNPNMLINGAVLGADGIIFDLEDSVSLDEKDSARILVRNTMKYLDFSGLKTIVRINPIDDTGFWKQDLAEIIPLSPSYIMPPKVTSKDDIKTISKEIESLEKEHSIEKNTIGLIPLLETAKGIENAYKIAKSSDRIKGIFLGAEDLASDIGYDRTKEGSEIFYARTRVVMAAKAAGVLAFDTPFIDIEDDEGMLEDTILAKSLGFSGKAAISPRHVDTINTVFSPTLDEIEYAREVIEADRLAREQGKGATSLYGKMIDAPIVARARETLDKSIQMGLYREGVDIE